MTNRPSLLITLRYNDFSSRMVGELGKYLGNVGYNVFILQPFMDSVPLRIWNLGNIPLVEIESLKLEIEKILNDKPNP